MAKGCLTLVSLILVIVVVFFVFTARPATQEEMMEVLDTEFNDQKDIPIYIELLETVNLHKKEVLETFSKDTSTCVSFPLVHHFPRGRPLPPALSVACDQIASKIDKSKSQTLLVCKNGSISLHVFKEDYDNYLYIKRMLYLNGSSYVRGENSGLIKHKTIRGKYHYLVEVKDAFNYMDPNNIAPN